MSEQIASLLTLAISPLSRPEISRRRNLLPDVQHCLREHAHDETLTPSTVAAMHGISKRYLHALFAEGRYDFQS